MELECDCGTAPSGSHNNGSPYGALLGPSWGSLGVPWGSLGALLGPSRNLLRAIRDGAGGPPGTPRRLQEGFERAPRVRRNLATNLRAELVRRIGPMSWPRAFVRQNCPTNFWRAAGIVNYQSKPPRIQPNANLSRRVGHRVRRPNKFVVQDFRRRFQICRPRISSSISNSSSVKFVVDLTFVVRRIRRPSIPVVTTPADSARLCAYRMEEPATFPPWRHGTRGL